MSKSKELPTDIIVDILSRVPARYILRFKSVSKSWYALFQNPNFISKHFQNQSSVPSFLFPPEKSTTPTSTSDHTVGLILSDSSYKSINFSIEIDISKSFDIYGICNGLICMSVFPLGSIILLWNPATRVFKDLPISPIHRPQADRLLLVVLGFGYDDVVMDYKVFRIVYFGNQMHQVEMFSLCTNSWREIKTRVDFIIYEAACRVFLNGKFHWAAFGFVDNHNTKLIVYFDLRDEVFNYIMLPKFEFEGCIGQYIDAHWQVVAMKESLAVIAWSENGSGVVIFEVWVLKEYRVVSSWTKYTSFELQTKVARPFGCGIKGEFLLVKDNEQLVVYDPDTQRFNNLGKYRFGYYSRVFNHVGSLIPINGEKVATRTNLSSVVLDAFFANL
ncbi:putative F-box protein At3g20705 [Rutidosis leptorrhynchoides]|uniref:putative F-box protein At3g20705 n=1 Tax=Rutidosis leptorrhynchoides TaxID=125765 RepID=UPI003A99E03D